jgi:protein TonB
MSGTANERFKEKFGRTLWGSVCVATAVHAAVLSFFPTMTAGEWGIDVSALEAIDLPADIVIPPPPTEIARPATPVIGDVDLDVTIAPTVLETRPEDRPLPPPPVTRGEDRSISDAPVFVPTTVLPELIDREAVGRELERRYPRVLRDAGIGGAPLVWFFIDEEGKVVKTQLRESSGHPALDEVALEVGRTLRFRPALNRDRKVAVWVSLPMRFQSR